MPICFEELGYFSQ